jgi:hypothetical protein
MNTAHDSLPLRLCGRPPCPQPSVKQTVTLSNKNPPGTPSDSQKFFGSFFQKRTVPSKKRTRPLTSGPSHPREVADTALQHELAAATCRGRKLAYLCGLPFGPNLPLKRRRLLFLTAWNQ